MKIYCHPELAAKSVETMSKRDFMPLPGVSGSDQLVAFVFSWGNAEISSALPCKPLIVSNKKSCKFGMT